MAKRVRVMSRSAGQILKESRLKQNLTQEQLADLVGCKKGTISKFEMNRNSIDVEWAKRLAPYVGLKPYQLLPNMGYEESEKQAQIDLEKLTADHKKALLEMYNYYLQKQKRPD